MKADRHKAIIDIVNSGEVETQEMLAELLAECGFNVTQATISRDIRQLNLVKTPGANGTSRYVVGGVNNRNHPGHSYGIREGVRDAVLSVDKAGNIVVIRTIPGMAMAVAAMVDAMNIDDIAGSIAGDDTIMCAVRSISQVDDVIEKLRVLQ